MTCKNCIHEVVCNKLCPNGLLPYQSSDYPAEVFCLEFKNQADVVSVKHGKWIEHHGQSYLVHPMKYDEYGPILQDYISYECSECGRTESKKEPYCNCGAKMDGGKDNDKQNNSTY